MVDVKQMKYGNASRGVAVFITVYEFTEFNFSAVSSFVA